MVRRAHEIPTHLNVEDKAFFGLSVRQLSCLIVGASSAYGLWNQWPELPLGLRAGLSAACLLVGLALALVRPGARGLEEWAFVLLHYATMPKRSVWRPEPDPAAWSAGGLAWTE